MIKSNVLHVNDCNVQIKISGFRKILFIGVSNLSICELVLLSCIDHVLCL